MTLHVEAIRNTGARGIREGSGRLNRLLGRTNTNGVESDYVTRDTTNDWTLSYTDLSCESGNTKCWFEACGEKLFRTEDA